MKDILRTGLIVKTIDGVVVSRTKDIMKTELLRWLDWKRLDESWGATVEIETNEDETEMVYYRTQLDNVVVEYIVDQKRSE